jgi:cytochrome c peroxidase
MFKACTIVGILFIIVVFFACLEKDEKTNEKKVIVEYIKDVDTLNLEVHKLYQAISSNTNSQQLQQQFFAARIAYKKTEWLAEYYNSYTAKSINGPAIPEVEADEKTKVVAPEGFQVIEEILFPDYNLKDSALLLQQTALLKSNAGRLKYVAATMETTDAHVFDAMRLETFRIITLGISGFDSPIANNSINEAASALKSLKKYCGIYNHLLVGKNDQLSNELNKLFNEAITHLSNQKEFNSFDRMFFIRRYLNPLSKNLLAAQRKLNIPVFAEPRFLKADAETLFSQNIFNPDFYTAGIESFTTADKVELGKKLFYDGILSADGKRSCATCHDPGKAFTDGLKKSLAVTGKDVRRNSPTLINAALQPALFYDMRVNYLEDQAKDVVSNKDEMHGSFDKALLHINKDSVYKRLFSKIYHGRAVTEFEIKNSIASYIRSLIDLNSRFDKYMQGDNNAMSILEIKGFNLFMGKAKCATCHFVPLFNGNNPPTFTKTDAEVIGVPATPNTNYAVLDKDEGKYNLYKIDLHKNAFKTPTLRNISLTAPYMHNGVYKSLEQVIEFYNDGGGAGLGLTVDNQTLPRQSLQLSEDEKKALLAFLKTLTGDNKRKTDIR